MVRALCVIAFAVLAFAAPARAAFDTCQHSGDEVTATFGSGTTGTLAVSGTQIRADGAQCGGTATVNNVDKIIVNGDAGDETLTIDLAGGPFAPGAFNESGVSDEIEIEVHLQSNFPLGPDILILGTTGVDTITLGAVDNTLGSPTRVNLNANEADGIDSDVISDQDDEVEIRGLAGNDVLDAGGGEGVPGVAIFGDLSGGNDGDTLTIGHLVNGFPGAGSDTIKTVTDGFGVLSYNTSGTGPIELTLQDGTGGAPGGGTAVGKDGFSGTDTFFGAIGEIIATNAVGADVLNGGPNGEHLLGLAGPDTINGGAGDDDIFGGSGVDTIHGGGDDDEIRADAGNDVVHGDDGNDILDGYDGDDDEFGEDGDDLFRQSGFGQSSAIGTNPNGADDFTGGAGIDTVQYGEPSSSLSITKRTAGVSADPDGVADDGAPLEGDNAHTDVENFNGGNGNDTLVGGSGPSVLRGLDGADTLRGGDGNDTLEGFGATGAFAASIEAGIEDDADDLDGQAGGDTVNANDGNDTIEARDGSADTLNCGTGNDTGRGDRIDTINGDCEGIELPVEMPAEPPFVPPPSEPPQQPPVTPPVTPPIVTLPGPAPKIGTLLTLPSRRRCASRRRFTVRVRREIRGTVKRVQIFINGKRVKSVTGSRINLPIDLRGLPKGRIRVRLRVELLDGRVATDTRTYRTCATKRRRGQFGRRRG